MIRLLTIIVVSAFIISAITGQERPRIKFCSRYITKIACDNSLGSIWSICNDCTKQENIFRQHVPLKAQLKKACNSIFNNSNVRKILIQINLFNRSSG